MNRLIKIGTAVLFSLFVAACNKADPAAEFKKLNDWSVNNQQSIAALQLEVQQAAATQDPAKIDEAVQKFKTKIADLQKELDAIEVKDPEITAYKAKVKTSLGASIQLMDDGINMMKLGESLKTDSSPEKLAELDKLGKQVQENSAKALKDAESLMKEQAELQKKYLAK